MAKSYSPAIRTALDDIHAYALRVTRMSRRGEDVDANKELRELARDLRQMAHDIYRLRVHTCEFSPQGYCWHCFVDGRS